MTWPLARGRGHSWQLGCLLLLAKLLLQLLLCKHFNRNYRSHPTCSCNTSYVSFGVLFILLLDHFRQCQVSIDMFELINCSVHKFICGNHIKPQPRLAQTGVSHKTAQFGHTWSGSRALKIFQTLTVVKTSGLCCTDKRVGSQSPSVYPRLFPNCGLSE